MVYMPFWFEKKKKKDRDLGEFDPFGFGDAFDKDFAQEIERLQNMMRSFMDPEVIKKLQQQSNKPIVSGFSIRMGPNGKVDVEQFGNVAPKGERPMVKDEREPMVDVINKPKEVTVIAELPGVDKKSISLKVTGENNVLDIFVPHKFSKKVKLPAKVRTKLAKANYKNGVLEVNLAKEREDKDTSGEIPVE